MGTVGAGKSMRLAIAAIVMLIVGGLLWVWEHNVTDEPVIKDPYWVAIREWGLGHPYLWVVWRLLSPLGGGGALMLITILVAIYLRSPANVQLLILSMVLASLLGGLIKEIADRPRPHLQPRSWPSGHSSAAFTLATVICVAKGRFLLWPWLCAIPIAASRVFVERHWPADVTAAFGVAFGVVFLAGRVPQVRFPRVRPWHGIALASAWLTIVLAGVVLRSSEVDAKIAWSCLLLIVLLVVSMQLQVRDQQRSAAAGVG